MHLIPTFDSQDCAKNFCSFLTDVEGNYEYFERYVNISKVLEWEDADKKRLKLKAHGNFVFGGDSQDKGTGDIRIVKLLVDLKDRYPDRVFLIIGNRDANKLRLTSELSEEALSSDDVKNDLDFPYWIPKDKVCATCRICKFVCVLSSRVIQIVTPAAFNKANNLEDNEANRLKWILKLVSLIRSMQG